MAVFALARIDGAFFGPIAPVALRGRAGSAGSEVIQSHNRSKTSEH